MRSNDENREPREWYVHSITHTVTELTEHEPFNVCDIWLRDTNDDKRVRLPIVVLPSGNESTQYPPFSYRWKDKSLSEAVNGDYDYFEMEELKGIILETILLAQEVYREPSGASLLMNNVKYKQVLIK